MLKWSLTPARHLPCAQVCHLPLEVLVNFLENFRKLVGGSVYGEVRYADFDTQPLWDSLLLD